MVTEDILQFIRSKFVEANNLPNFLMTDNTILKELKKAVNDNDEVMSYVMNPLNALLASLSISTNDFTKCKAFVHGLPYIKFYGDNSISANIIKFSNSLKQTEKEVVDYTLADNYYHHKLNELNDKAHAKAKNDAINLSIIAKAEADAKEVVAETERKRKIAESTIISVKPRRFK